MAEIKLSKIEKTLLGTAILGSWANLTYTNCADNPNENYVIAIGLGTFAMGIGPIARTMYHFMKDVLTFTIDQ